MKNTGFYSVGSKNFFSKLEAIKHSIENKLPIKWLFHNEIWEKFSKEKLHTLGAESLDSIYKQRAIQLREKYDYLILNYSGGADSHNVLMTFLNNNIRLDEIYVQYSHRVDRNLYVPNKDDLQASNIFSEFDYCIEPVLHEVKNLFPNVKITFGDIFEENYLSLYNDNIITNYHGHYNGSFEILRQSVYSSTIDNLTDKGKKVADIFGIDKPNILFKDNKFFIFFADNITSVGSKTYLNKDISSELFYWAPDFPSIVFEQAFKLYTYFCSNKKLLNEISKESYYEFNPNRIDWLRELTIDLIYSTWDYKFQVRKPENFNIFGRTRDIAYIKENTKFKNYLERHQFYYRDLKKYQDSIIFKIYPSPAYFIGDLK